MKTKLIITFIVATVLLAIYGFLSVRAHYEYEREVKASWTLADKSSTIPAKRQHLDKFVSILENQGLNGRYNALMYPTADNSFDANVTALKTLQQRLHEIEGMDIRSFEYQTAIQQITAQEQGEAQAMLEVFEGTWYLKNHFLMWDYVSILIFILLGATAVVSGFILLVTLGDL